jgi:hypothetical protein
MKEEMILTRESLLQKDDLKKEKVQLTKGVVYVREMTAGEKNAWEMSMLNQRRTGDSRNPISYETSIENYRVKLAINTVCDKDGNLLFTAKDISLLAQSMSAANMEKIVDVASKLNAITNQDKEEILKNLEAEREEDSNSNSAEN